MNFRLYQENMIRTMSASAFFHMQQTPHGYFCVMCSQMLKNSRWFGQLSMLNGEKVTYSSMRLQTPPFFMSNNCSVIFGCIHNIMEVGKRIYSQAEKRMIKLHCTVRGFDTYRPFLKKTKQKHFITPHYLPFLKIQINISNHKFAVQRECESEQQSHVYLAFYIYFHLFLYLEGASRGSPT